jgi:hypothetical protein
MRSALQVRYAGGVVIPHRAIPVESSMTMAIEQYTVTTQLKGSALVLIPHRQRIV